MDVTTAKIYPIRIELVTRLGHCGVLGQPQLTFQATLLILDFSGLLEEQQSGQCGNQHVQQLQQPPEVGDRSWLTRSCGCSISTSHGDVEYSDSSDENKIEACNSNKGQSPTLTPSEIDDPASVKGFFLQFFSYLLQLLRKVMQRDETKRTGKRDYIDYKEIIRANFMCRLSSIAQKETA